MCKPTTQRQQQANPRMPARGVCLSSLATSKAHGEDSPYFDGWKEYDANPYHPTDNPSGVIQMGLAENQLSFDLLESWLLAHPKASICAEEGVSRFKEIALYQDYHGLPACRKAIAKFMEEVGGRKAMFEKDRIVLTAGATAAHEVLTFCLADPGEAFLVPTPYYPGFDRDLRWRTGVELIPVHCSSDNDFQITIPALEAAYQNARDRNIQVKGLLITNPSNPLGTTMDATALRKLLAFVSGKNIHLVCDEIYSGSVFSSPKSTSIAEILATDKTYQSERVHIIYSLSKDLGLPGFRVGVIYSYNDTVVTAARRMSSFSLVSSQTQHLLASMLSDMEFVRKYLAENSKRLQKRHEMFVSGLRLAGINCLNSNGALFCWVDLRHLLESHDQEGEVILWKIVLKEIGLNVSPGSSCHCSEFGWFRFCFANMTDQIVKESLNRIQLFMKSRRSNQLYDEGGAYQKKPLNADEASEEFNFTGKYSTIEVDNGSLRSMNVHSSGCLRLEEATRSEVPQQELKDGVY
uniref:ACC synthase n=1 Tax=Picea engelmannii x Picea glauca TaxID=373101 RepID=A2IA39_PICXS|nr:ACC synthase [Picea engelmannii x Picea glauca]